MAVALQVLLIEDCDDDAALLLRELRRGGYEPVSQRVQTGADLAAALEQQEWDVVISDYTMPQFSGMTALAMIRERCPDLPFILVSGMMGEETAVTAMKAGANDYLLKSALSRLAPAVRRETHEVQARRSAEARNAAILESALDCIITMDHEGKITQFNPAAERTFGYKRQDVLGRELAEIIIPPEFRESHRRGLTHYRNTGEGPILNRRIEIIGMRSDGSQFPVELAITRINLSGPPAFSACLRDITQRRQTEEELRQVQQELESRVIRRTAELASVNNALQIEVGERKCAEAEAQHGKDIADAGNRAKSEFLANMSHEIRTPMTAVIGYADLLLDPEQSPSERLNCVNIIRRNAEHLLTVINDILDISKIEAGKMTVERVECEPRRIIGEVTSLMRVRAAEKNLHFTVEYDGPIPRTVRSDPTRLRQILINLVSNAVKFTESGGVRIGVKLIQGSTGPVLRFEVVDSGIGMSGEQLQRMFTAFEQADSSTTRRFGGTGLGLTISKRLAALLGGDITAQSDMGRGSRFVCTVETGPLDGVPMLDNPHEAADAESHSIQKQWRLTGSVLLAEDGADNQQLLSAYLRRAGCEVVIAGNGRIACEKALEAVAAGRPFDVILMDMQMPELDGYGAASLLRAKGYEGVIIALTAHAMSEDRTKCLQSGCNDYLTKPISRQILLDALARHLEVVAPDAESLHSSADDEDLRKFLPMFVDHLPGQVGKLLELLRRQDLDELSNSVHQLKGTGGLYGFMPISESAARAEQAVRRSDTLESVAREVDELISIIRRVEGYDRAKEPSAVAVS